MPDPDMYHNFSGRQPEHSLGSYRSWALSDRISAPFDLVWIHLADSNTHFILPHGEPSIAISRKRDSDGSIENPRCVICGGYGAAHLYGPPAGEELIAVRIKPELAKQILRFAPADYADQGPVDAGRFLNEATKQSRSAAVWAPAEYVAQLLYTDILRATASLAAPTDNKCEMYAAHILRRTSGIIRLNELVTLLDVSERTIRRRFNNATGFSPKAYARRLRLTNALLNAERQEKPHWAAIAAVSGYHDQPHFIAECRALTGDAPSGVLRRRSKMSENYKTG